MNLVNLLKRLMPASRPPGGPDAEYRRRLARLLEPAPSPDLPPHRLFHGVEDDFWLWMNTEGYRHSAGLRQVLPGLPDDETAAIYVGSGGDKTLREGFQAYQLFKGEFEKYVGPMSTCAAALDFGCGWGRVLRFFLKDLDPVRLHGIDADPGAIDLCRRTNRWCRFAASGIMPPTPFADDTFDLVFLYSVFSHVFEEAQQHWLTEFHRILRPGGLVVATTWHREFIQWCADLRRDPCLPCEPNWRKKLADVFPDTRKALADYDAGRFCFGEYDAAKYPEAWLDGVAYFGEACVPQGYVLEHWTDRFAFRDFIDDRARCLQNVIVAQKR